MEVKFRNLNEQTPTHVNAQKEFKMTMLAFTRILVHYRWVEKAV
jgi:hypothetical protein